MNTEATSPGPALPGGAPFSGPPLSRTTWTTTTETGAPGTGTTWTPERVQQLRSFVTAGFTCSRIADEIGVTRNAVIGKIHRLGLSPGRKPAGVAQRMRPAAAPARTPRSLLARLLRAAVAEAPALVPDATAVEVAAVESGKRCSLLELTAGSCRWPIGDPGKDDFGFCGNDSMTGISYCAGHARIAYRLPSGRRA